MRKLLVVAAMASAILLTLAPVAAFACTPDYVPILQCDWTAVPSLVFVLFVPVLYFVLNCYFVNVDLNNCSGGVTVDAWSPLSLLRL
jgi:hypothetical protein